MYLIVILTISIYLSHATSLMIDIDRFCIQINESNLYIHSHHYINAIIIAIFVDKVRFLIYINYFTWYIFIIILIIKVNENNRLYCDPDLYILDIFKRQSNKT